MARHLFYIFLLTLVSVATAHPASAQTDTTIYQLKEVKVFGKPAEVYAVGSRVSSIDSTYLHTHASGTLADALQAQTPLYIKQYGPAGISTVTFRGTSAQHTAVLWNGLNITSPSLGQADFTTLPLSGTGSIAVQHGGASAIYGSGAIGGAILLNSPVYEEGHRAKVQVGIGSYNRYFSKASASFGNSKVTAGGSFFWQKAANNFPFHDLSRVGNPEGRVEHAALLQKGFTQDLTWKVIRRGKLSLHSWYTATDREIQPAIGAAHNNAAYTDRNLRILAGYQQQNWLGEAAIKAAYFSDQLTYASNTLTALTAVKTYQAQAEQSYVYANKWSMKGGLNIQRFVADVDGYGGPVTENRASLFLLTRYNPSEFVSLTLNLRQAFAEGYNPPPTPALGANWIVLKANDHQLSLKGNIAGSYRLPTLNERFWQPGGNPDLKPEQGHQAEAGLAHTLEKKNFKLKTEITPYIMLVNNWVEWQASGNISVPVNLQRVRSQGVELSSHATLSFNDWLVNSTLSYTYSSSEQVAAYEGNRDPGNQLAYIPLHKATFYTGVTYKSWNFTGNVIYNSKRFTSASNTTALDAFTLMDAGIGKTFELGNGHFQANLQVHNLMNTRYQTMQNYAMPLRNYQMQLSYSLSNSLTNK